MRTSLLYALLKVGLAVTGAMIAMLGGVVFAYGIGMWGLRDVLRVHGTRVPLRSMAGFAVTAAAGTLGVILLFNLDVVLAKHYLREHDAGIYGGLNKIGTIVYYLTLSVSQVLFPRVVEAVHRNAHPGRLLLMSAGIMSALGACALLVFGLFPGLVVNVLFTSTFHGEVGRTSQTGKAISGGYLTGYQILHGSKKSGTLNDVQIEGKFTAQSKGSETTYTVTFSDLQFTWNDIINVNRDYHMDKVLANYARWEKEYTGGGAHPKDYAVHIKWTAPEPVTIEVTGFLPEYPNQ